MDLCVCKIIHGINSWMYYSIDFELSNITNFFPLYNLYITLSDRPIKSDLLLFKVQTLIPNVSHNMILLDQIRRSLTSRCQIPQICFVHIHFGNRNVEFTSTAALFSWNPNCSAVDVFLCERMQSFCAHNENYIWL